jgi:hypothetical protein
MAPTMVFDASGALELIAGSPGGSLIIGYVAKALIATLDWNLDPQQAIDLPNFGSRNGPTELEQGTELEGLQAALKGDGPRRAPDSHDQRAAGDPAHAAGLAGRIRSQARRRGARPLDILSTGVPTQMKTFLAIGLVAAIAAGCAQAPETKPRQPRLRHLRPRPSPQPRSPAANRPRRSSR